MAERNPTAPQVVDPLERQISDTIHRLIGLLNVRRVELLNLVRDKRAADRLPQQMIDQLTETQEQLDKDLRQNMLQPLKKRIMRKLECKKRETVLQTPVETLTEVKCDTHELETMISNLGEIVEVPVVSVPRYATFHSSVIATGNEGSDPGELFWPRLFMKTLIRYSLLTVLSQRLETILVCTIPHGSSVYHTADRTELSMSQRISQLCDSTD